MKFGKYLLANASPEWLQHYVDYRALKKQLRLGRHDGSATTGSISPRTTSLTTGRGGSASLSGLAEETFLVALNHEVQKVSQFTDLTSGQLLRAIQQLNATLGKLPLHADVSRHAQQAHVLSERSQALEKYVNLNAQAFQKIIKKHDKLFPRAQVWQFYKVHLHRQAWHATSLQAIWEALTAAYNRIHTSTVPSATTPLLLRSRSAQVILAQQQQQQPTPPQPPTQRPTTLKFWITPENTPAVKHALLEHLPVRITRVPGSSSPTTAVQHTRHCIYLDNSSLELYHSNLYQVRSALAVKLTWQDFGAGQCWPCPVAIQRRVRPHSWRAEPDAKASITISSEHLDQMLDGSLTVQQAWLDCLQLRSSQGQGSLGASAASSRRASADAAHHSSAQRMPQAAGSSSAWQQQHAQARTAAPAAAHACAQDAGHEPPPHSSSEPPAAPQHSLSTHATGQQAHHSSMHDPAPAPPFPPSPAPSPPEHFTRLFQELQQLQDVKQLVPQVYSSCSRATFQMPFDRSLVAMLDEQVRFSAAGSSYSYSRRPKQQQVRAGAAASSIRPSQQDQDEQQQQGQPWQQQARAEQPVYELPYNVLKLVLAPGEQLPHWLRLLIAQGLLHEAEDFSGFVHGCAVLAPDVVRALPFWVDDPLVQRSIAAFACHLPGEEGWLEWGGGEEGGQGGSHGISGEGLREALLRPGSPRGRRREVESWVASRVAHVRSRLAHSDSFTRLAALAHYHQEEPARQLPGAIPALLVEPHTYYAAERSLMAWLQMSVLLGGITTMLLGYSATAKRRHGIQVELHIAATIAMVLLPLPPLMAGYALLTFLWRRGQLARFSVSRAARVDDRLGPLLMCAAFVLSMVGVVVANVVDLKVLWRAGHRRGVGAAGGLGFAGL